jgi:maltooligosyltrehalose synthase
LENDQVFNDTHSLVLRWLLEGMPDGVRVDHIDGLRDPLTYLKRVAKAAPERGSWWKRFSRLVSVCQNRGPSQKPPVTIF